MHYQNLGSIGIEDLQELDDASRLEPEYPAWIAPIQGGDRLPGETRDWSQYAVHGG